jgi:hypothetical protein
MPSTTDPALCRHIRRHRLHPEGSAWILDCDCGWRGRIPVAQRREDADSALEAQFVEHLKPEERQTYLLCDTRKPACWRSLAEIIADDHLPLDAAQQVFHAQPQIIGNFVMPEGLPVMLLASREEEGMHFGTFRIGTDGESRELPIGEVRTPEGRVFRAE